MACESWTEKLVSHLYGEITAKDDDHLRKHLAGCASCREELESLSKTRDRLRDAEPAVPVAPRVVVLSSRSPRRSLAAMAAGIAAAGLLAGAAFGLGARMSGKPSTPGSSAQAAGKTSAETAALKSWLEDRMARVDERMDAQSDALTSLASQVSQSPAVTRPELEAQFAEFERKTKRNRSEELQFVLDEIAAAEVRTGLRLGETQNALRYLALASDPRLTEQ